jgi:hypothetical protein
MTTPYERTRAVLGARQLLSDLAAAPDDADLGVFRGRARALLRHLSAAMISGIWADPDAKWYE